MKMINTNLSPVDPNAVSQIKLVDGSLMPQAAMGTFHSDNPDLMKGMEDIVIEAIRLGYRHIDCATAYQNEEIVGQAIEKSIKSGLVKREDLFILSKLWNKNMKPDEVIPALKKTLID